jgi:hypothetical protein
LRNNGIITSILDYFGGATETTITSTGEKQQGTQEIQQTTETKERIEDIQIVSPPPASIVIQEQAPEVTFEIVAVLPGGALALRWGSSGAERCVGANLATADKTSGEVVVVPPTTTTEYTVTCYTPGGSNTTKSVAVTPASSLSGTEPPSIQVSIDSNLSGTPQSFSWETIKASTCTSPDFDTGGNTSGTFSLLGTVSKNYTLTCTGPGGSHTATTFVEIPEVIIEVSDPTLSIAVVNGEGILSWTSPISTCVILGPNGFSHTTATKTGSVNVGPVSGTLNYTISCSTQ